MTRCRPIRRFRARPEISRLAVKLAVWFPLSPCNVEDLLHERGIEVSHEAVRFGWQRLGPMFAAKISKRCTEGMRSGRWRWHLDEIFVTINGESHFLRRASDQEGEVLESLVAKSRDKVAALKFLRKSMRRSEQPDTIVTDRRRSCGSALKQMGRGDDRETGRWLNSRAENLHRHFEGGRGQC